MNTEWTFLIVVSLKSYNIFFVFILLFYFSVNNFFFYNKFYLMLFSVIFMHLRFAYERMKNPSINCGKIWMLKKHTCGYIFFPMFLVFCFFFQFLSLNVVMLRCSHKCLFLKGLVIWFAIKKEGEKLIKLFNYKRNQGLNNG